MFDNLSKEDLIKLLQNREQENSALQEKLQQKQSELKEKDVELKEKDGELQQKREELKQTQAEIKAIKDFCKENHNKVIQLIVNSKVRLKSYSNSDLYPEHYDYEQSLSLEYRLVESLIINNLRLSRLHAEQFEPSSEKIGIPGGRISNNESEKDPEETEVQASLSKEREPEESTANSPQAEPLSKDEQACDIAQKALKKVEKELNKAGKEFNRLFPEESDAKNNEASDNSKADAGNSDKKDSKKSAAEGKRSEKTTKADSKDSENSKADRTSDKTSSSAFEGFRKLAEFMNVGSHLKSRTPLNKNFMPDNRCSKKQKENNLELGADEIDIGGSLSSSEGLFVYCPVCKCYEKAEVIYNGNENDHMLNITRYRLEMIERLVKKFKCEKCGSIISDKLIPDSDKVAFDEKKSVNPGNSRKFEAPLSENFSALPVEDIQKQQEEDIKQMEDHLNSIVSASELVQQNQQLMKDNSRLTSKQFAYCNIGMMFPSDFNLKTATMFPVVTGGKLTIGSIATFIFEHNYNNTPYSRIFSHFRYSGLKRTTAFAAIKAFDRLVLHKEALIIRNEILKSHVIHADESQVHVRAADSEGRENRMFTCWQICNSNLDEARYAWYDINESRSQDVPYNIFKDADISDAVVLTDGNQTYDRVLRELSAKHAYCYAHMRRAVLEDLTDMKLKESYKELISECSCYEDVFKKFPEFIKRHDINYEKGLMIALFFNINCLFALEHDLEITDEDYLEQVKEIRTSHSRFFMDNIEEIVKELAKKSVYIINRDGVTTYKANKEEIYGKSIAYALKRLDGLKRFLSDPEIPLTNSLCERGFRDFAVAKHGFYFIDSIDGTHSFADQMTICQSCHNNGVDPHNYMVWLGWNVYNRYMQKHPTGRITAPATQYIPANEIPKDEISRYKIRTDLKDLPAGEYAEIGIYDRRYKAITDDIDFTGLGILDYKKQCLKDRL